MTLRITFQGERGAYSESAAINFFGKNAQTISCPTFSNALDLIGKGECEYAVLPIENSIEGSVGESYDLLYEMDLKVRGEAYQKIEHCLIGEAPDVSKVQTVYSHPQALGQCRSFIQSHDIKIVPTYDTAGSVGIVKVTVDDVYGRSYYSFNAPSDAVQTLHVTGDSFMVKLKVLAFLETNHIQTRPLLPGHIPLKAVAYCSYQILALRI